MHQPPQPQPYPGQWQGGPPPRNRTGLIVGLATALVVAVAALVVVLITKGDDDSSGGSAHGGTTNGGLSATRPSTVPNAQPSRSDKPYEQLALDFVSAVQNNDLDGARRLTCASFRGKVRIAPLDLRSPDGTVVNKIDAFLLGGSSALTDSGEVSKANVGVRLKDGDQGVQWILAVRTEGGEQRICGSRVLNLLDIVPSVA